MKTTDFKVESMKKTAGVLLENLERWDTLSAKKVRILQEDLDTLQSLLDDIANELYKEAWSDF